MKRPGPQIETWRAGGYRLPQRPEGGGWIIGLGIVLMCVAAIGVAVAIAVQAMQPK